VSRWRHGRTSAARFAMAVCSGVAATAAWCRRHTPPTPACALLRAGRQGVLVPQLLHLRTHVLHIDGRLRLVSTCGCAAAAGVVSGR
jgi:hypothetical protein